MIIRYFNGRTVQAVLLSQADGTIRVAIQGADDATQFCNIHGCWVSDDCEPARIDFAWQPLPSMESGQEDQWSCSDADDAARLIHLIVSNSADDEHAGRARSAADALEALFSASQTHAMVN